MMNAPGSGAFADSRASTRLYSDYVNWLREHSDAIGLPLLEEDSV